MGKLASVYVYMPLHIENRITNFNTKYTKFGILGILFCTPIVGIPNLVYRVYHYVWYTEYTIFGIRLLGILLYWVTLLVLCKTLLGIELSTPSFVLNSNFLTTRPPVHKTYHKWQNVDSISAKMGYWVYKFRILIVPFLVYFFRVKIVYKISGILFSLCTEACVRLRNMYT